MKELFDINKLTCLIDLHLHVDGAISVDNARALASIQNIDIPKTDEELLGLLRVSDNCKDLNEFLEKFAFPCSLLKRYDAVKLAFTNLTKELKDQGVMYAELRFAPQLCTADNFNQDDVVKAAIEGTSVVEGIKTQLILCCMRGADKALNIENIDVAKKYLNKGVCAIDLAGAEGLFPTCDYEYLFEYAKELNIPYTIHAGEAAGPESVYSAIEFGASRIGHGIRSAEDPKLVKLLASKQIPLEHCPTSNVKTGIYKSIDEEPHKELLDAGVLLTINTDDPSVEGTSIKQEYQAIIDSLELTKEDVKKLLINAANASFTDEKTKEELIKRITLEID